MRTIKDTLGEYVFIFHNPQYTCNKLPILEIMTAICMSKKSRPQRTENRMLEHPERSNKGSSDGRAGGSQS